MRIPIFILFCIGFCLLLSSEPIVGYFYLLTAFFFYLAIKDYSQPNSIPTKKVLLGLACYLSLWIAGIFTEKFLENQYDKYQFNKLCKEGKLIFITDFENFRILKRQKYRKPIRFSSRHAQYPYENLPYRLELFRRESLRQALQKKIHEMKRLLAADNNTNFLGNLSDRDREFCDYIRKKENFSEDSLLFLYEYTMHLSDIFCKENFAFLADMLGSLK